MIKSITLAIAVSLAITAPLHAEDKAVTMRTMLDGMNLIQLGILTNTKNLVEDGVFQVKVGKDILNEVDHSQYLSLDEVQAIVFTQEKTKQLDIHVSQLLKEYQAGEVVAAMDEYNLLTKQCVECHMKLRDYKDREPASPVNE